MSDTLLSNIDRFLQNSLWLWQQILNVLSILSVLFLLEVIVLLLIRIICLMKASAAAFLIWWFFPLDTLQLFRIENETRVRINLIKKGIAWWTDKNVKFRNPTGDGNNLTALFQGKKKKGNCRNNKTLQRHFNCYWFLPHWQLNLLMKYCSSLEKSKLRTTAF